MHRTRHPVPPRWLLLGTAALAALWPAIEAPLPAEPCLQYARRGVATHTDEETGARGSVPVMVDSLWCPGGARSLAR